MQLRPIRIENVFGGVAVDFERLIRTESKERNVTVEKTDVTFRRRGADAIGDHPCPDGSGA